MRKLIFVVALVTAAALPAAAGAHKYFSPVSIHADDYHFAEQIYGSVESQKAKCERNRTIQLHYAEFSDGPPTFTQIMETTTNLKGEYQFFPEKPLKRGNGTFDSGRYFARVTKRKVGGDACLRDDSRIIEIFNDPCNLSQAESAAAPSRKAPVIC